MICWRTDTIDVTVDFFASLWYNSNRFIVTARLLSNGSQKMSKWGENAHFLLLPHSDSVCDLLLHSNMESTC